MNRGFSTVEMLIAMTVLILAISAVVLLSPGTQSLSVDSQTDFEALNKAQEMLAEQEARARVDFRLVNSKIETENIEGQEYTKLTEVTMLPDYVTKKIKAIVSSSGMYGRTRSTSLTTLVTNYEDAESPATCDSMFSGQVPDASTSRLFGDFIPLDSGFDSAGLYPVSDLNMLHNTLYASVAAGNAFLGFNNPGAAENMGAGVAWNSPNAAVGEDSARATVPLAPGGVSGLLKVSDFGFSIPQGATITGITIEIKRSVAGATASGIQDAEVRLLTPDGTVGNRNYAVSTAWPRESSESYRAYTVDMNDVAWTYENLGDPGFGVVISARSTGTVNKTAQIDAVRIKIEYTKALYVFDTSSPENPVFFGGLGTSSSNVGFSALAVATLPRGTYVYAAPLSGSHLQIIDASTMPARMLSSYTLPSAPGSNVKSMYYARGYVYLGTNGQSAAPEVHIIDVHDPSRPVEVGSWPKGESPAFNGGITALFVKGSYAYLAHPPNPPFTEQLTILDVSNPTDPKRAGGSFNPPGGSSGSGNGESIDVVGNTVYLGRAKSAAFSSIDSIPEFYGFSLESSGSTVATTSIGIPTSISPGTDGIYGIFIRDVFAFLYTGNQSSGKAQMRILNIMDPQNPEDVGPPFTLPDSGEPVALDCEGEYFYAASNPLSGANTNRSSLSIFYAP